MLAHYKLKPCNGFQCKKKQKTKNKTKKQKQKQTKKATTTTTKRYKELKRRLGNSCSGL